MRRRLGLRLGAAFAGAALALAACGGGDGEQGGGTATSSGEPVKLMIIAPVGTTGANHPEMVAAVRAAARGVNERGGIKGHPVEILHCNEKNDPTAAKECAQKAVDEHVLAVVSTVNGSGGIMPILEEAGIPAIGSAGIAADGSELSSDVSFVVSPLTFYPAVCPSLLRKAGASKVGLVGYDLSASDRLITMAQAGGRAAGAPINPELRIPITSSDLTPTVAQLSRAGADGAVLVVFDQAAYAVIGGGDPNLRTCHAAGTLSKEYLATLGPAADNLVVASAFPELSQAAEFPELKRMISEMDAEAAGGDADARAELRDSTETTGAWLSVQIAEKVGNSVSGDLTTKSLLEQLRATKGLDLGVIPPLDFTTPNPIPGVERVFNTTMRGARWNSAQHTFVPLGPETYEALGLLTRGAS
ncbi:MULTISPECIES: ABC transporter substrate-binding protein [Parafrankia]|uniref:Branched-chain amino acid ABC transporter substrate-binding protein n=2 Tax=Parafrankia TaxID=2994362 RepID=A0A1S1QYE9_9ACTN|nr:MULTISPECIES: ABC transporter substrate-binding protein [Parafrankia]OHV38549.1 branched-chain amino acid ABC transporter substrate-binding protein [Parafrankia soli]TCJ33212.1 branched-chain amino acid ABC transporter substrate-binding protein [Parafrankia sp. BMG5.11]CAI7974553.1 Branched-chain amino acid ABC transporter substrate-binding protein [Frankia sp. Hr75.2]